jgi:GMP synthase (glutamine-hydrolysing)
MVLVFDNVVDPAFAPLTDEIARRLDDATVVNVPDGDPVPPLERVDAAVVTGSSAGVYETDERPWIDRETSVVRSLVDRRVPTLGICFGHQLINAALGGRVERRSLMAGFVRASLDDTLLFDGVSPVVPVVHADHVTASGDGMERIGSADHCPIFASRHRSAPIWTVQYHPELTAEVARTCVEPAVGWEDGPCSHADSTAVRTLPNFERIVAGTATG